MKIHKMAATNVKQPATVQAIGQPYWSLIRGVRMGEKTPATVVPVFMIAPMVPA